MGYLVEILASEIPLTFFLGVRGPRVVIQGSLCRDFYLASYVGYWAV